MGKKYTRCFVAYLGLYILIMFFFFFFSLNLYVKCNYSCNEVLQLCLSLIVTWKAEYKQLQANIIPPGTFVEYYYTVRYTELFCRVNVLPKSVRPVLHNYKYYNFL